MTNRNTLHSILVFTSFILLTACGSNSEKGPQPHRPLNLNNESESFIAGANDGCDTAAENYKKDHEAFNNDFEYNEGWWAGRQNCESRAKLHESIVNIELNTSDDI